MVKQTEGLAYASGISVHQAEEYNMTTGANPATFTNFETSLITPVASTVLTTIIEGTGLKPHNSIGAHKSAALLRLVLHSHRRQRPMDPASRLCIVLLLEMVTPRRPERQSCSNRRTESRWTRDDDQRQILSKYEARFPQPEPEAKDATSGKTRDVLKQWYTFKLREAH
ncbi:hypothetical protein PI125_g3074 [Phytophthora idaei]|nr:hypothetical protein PI125_g3074 [Phytophthora idaei]KAG3168588.1 hypothetical protein PI126_g3236 [Phytophthora idaei]